MVKETQQSDNAICSSIGVYIFENGFDGAIIKSYFENKTSQESKKGKKTRIQESKLKNIVSQRYTDCSKVIEEYSEFNAHFNANNSKPSSFKCDMVRPALPMLPKNPKKCLSLAQYYLQFGLVVYTKFNDSLQNTSSSKKTIKKTRKPKSVGNNTSTFVSAVKYQLKKKENTAFNNDLETIINGYYETNCEQTMYDYNLFYEFYTKQKYDDRGDSQTEKCDFFVRLNQSTLT